MKNKSIFNMFFKLFVLIFIVLIALNLIGLSKERFQEPSTETNENKEFQYTIYFENEKTDFVYELDMHRIYLPIHNIVELLGGEIEEEEKFWESNIDNHNYNFFVNEDYLIKDGDKIFTRSKPIIERESIYYDLATIAHSFNLVCNFDYDDESIYIFKDRKLNTLPKKITLEKGKNKSYLRLEDIVGKGLVNEQENSNNIKLRALADLLYENNIPFHVAWIPRYINPKENIDNDLATVFNIDNINYIYSLDYLIFKNGYIGLHGYTHQSGDIATAVGNDFGIDNNTTAESATKQIKKAIKIADDLNIPIHFFEFPHYEATDIQLEQGEKLFKYIYQPYSVDYLEEVKKVKDSFYIPTPFNYLDGIDDVDGFKERNKPLIEKGIIGSFYYHTYLDFISIKFSTDKDNYLTYSYSEDARLYLLIQYFIENGYSFDYIENITLSNLE